MSASRTTKRHMNLMSVIVFVTCLLLVGGNAVFAYPYLQLDAEPAVYDPISESILTTVPQFTLYALVNSEAPDADLTDTFYISAALVPSIPEADPDEKPDLGSFYFDGIEYDVVGSMAYGTPPLEEHLSDELPPHGVYETYFYEFDFPLDPTNTAFLYDSMVDPGGLEGGLDTDPAGTLIYEDFSVDVSNLATGYDLTFDFYTLDSDGIAKFAPFSHNVVTPVPASVILGMLGLGVVGLKLRKFA